MKTDWLHTTTKKRYWHWRLFSFFSLDVSEWHLSQTRDFRRISKRNRNNGCFKLNTCNPEILDYTSAKYQLSQKLVHELICMLSVSVKTISHLITTIEWVQAILFLIRVLHFVCACVLLCGCIYAIALYSSATNRTHRRFRSICENWQHRSFAVLHFWCYWTTHVHYVVSWCPTNTCRQQTWLQNALDQIEHSKEQQRCRQIWAQRLGAAATLWR